MADHDELQQLRAQRESVAQHLRWLDELIRNCETESTAGVSHAATSTIPLQPSPPHAQQPAPASTGQPYEAHLDPQTVKISLRHQTMGCIGVAIFVVALAIFTLWILPSFIYD